MSVHANNTFHNYAEQDFGPMAFQSGRGYPAQGTISMWPTQDSNDNESLLVVQAFYCMIIAFKTSVHVNISLTEVKTSVVCWMVAILVHFHFWKSCTRVGLCNVAEGCVRKKVGKRWRLESAGELDP